MRPEIVFSKLCEYYTAKPDARGQVHIVCPSCGKEPKRKQTHCSFYNLESGSGWHCFVCGAGGSLVELAQNIGLISPPTGAIKPLPRKPQKLPRRENEPAGILWREKEKTRILAYYERQDRYEFWSQYKPVSRETIDEWHLGIGALPYYDKRKKRWTMMRDERLIVPIFEKGEIVGLRGRALGNKQPKWISATGSSAALYGLDNLGTGEIIVVCENHVDAILFMQEYKGYKAVASTAGVACWRDEWSVTIAASKPQSVVILFDNDKAGFVSAPKVWKSLLKVGVRAVFFDWERAKAPDKADLGWLIMNRVKASLG